MYDSERALDSASSFGEESRLVARFLTRVSRRVLWFKLVRGAALALAATAALILGVALYAGPSLSVLGAILSWSAVLVGAVLAGAVGLGSLDNLSGARRAKLVSAHRPALAARLRCAAELAERPNGSPALIAALAREVAGEIERVPLDEVVPRPRHHRLSSLIGFALALTCAALIGAREDATAGLYALLHPGSHDPQGSLVGLWVSNLRAHVRYPARSVQREATLENARTLHVPEGSILELTLTPRVAIERAVLKLGERTLPFNRSDDGQLTLTLTAEESAPLELKARVGEAWVTDPEARALEVENDTAPVVELLAPTGDQRADPEQRVTFRYRARDDHGLDGLDLVVQLGPSRERRLKLSSFPQASSEREEEGSTDVTPAAFGARPGQTLAVWIEARDRDAYGGANVGRSPVRTITVGEPSNVEGPEIELLRKARDLALDVLAERLETPLDEGTRARKLARRSREFGSALGELGNVNAAGSAKNATVFADMSRRIARLIRDESSASGERAEELDERFVSELEQDVLFLSDLLGRAKLDAAQGALERLAATRARMRKLLEELKKSDDPEQRAELMAEIARARAELRDIAERLSEAEADVPSDFVNYDALRREAGDNPLEQLEQALASGDIDAAERALAELEEHMASLEKGLESGDRAFAGARFAQRSRELDQARSELNELSQSQEQLAKETDRIAQRARGEGAEQRAQEANNQRLAAQSEALERRTRRLEAGQVQPAVSDAQSTAAQRLRDARDALRQGEVGEAQSMAERAVNDLEALAMEMRLDARMFPGRDGSRMGAAREADQLARDVARFAEEVQGAQPKRREQLAPGDREALRKQAPSQGSLEERAGKLSQAAREKGAESMQSGLSRAREAMRQAEQALERGDLDDARAEQRDALERLRETSEELEREASASRGERGGEQREGTGESGTDTEKVAIPQGEGDARRSELRRRVLDARRAPTPSSFERSVERYYQEILR